MTTKSNTGPRIFVTVGSTKFTNLVTAILSSSVLDAVSQATHSSAGEEAEAFIMIQFGATPIQDILLSSRLGLQDDNEATEGVGTLPMKILSDCPSIEASNLTDIAASLSPEAIKDEVLNGDGGSGADRFGLKHFSMEWEASHGTVHLEFIDYVSSIGPHLKKADVVISHAGERPQRDLSTTSG